MKTSINFYVDDLKPKRYLLTLTNTAILTAIALVLMLAWFGSLLIENNSLQSKNNVITVELDGAQEELTMLQAALVKHTDNSAFKSQKQHLVDFVAAKQAMLNYVNSKTNESSVDYYQVMKDLTEHHDHDLWLTQFTFNQDKVSFQGYAIQSKAVTNWMSFLQATSSFSGREFSLLEIKEYDDQVVQFTTATDISNDVVGDD